MLLHSHEGSESRRESALLFCFPPPGEARAIALSIASCKSAADKPDPRLLSAAICTAARANMDS